MDGDLLLMPMFPVHVAHPAEAVPAVGIGEADEVHPLHVLDRIGIVHRLSALRSIGTAELLHVPRRRVAVR